MNPTRAAASIEEQAGATFRLLIASKIIPKKSKPGPYLDWAQGRAVQTV
jgi:hypothetical protein